MPDAVGVSQNGASGSCATWTGSAKGERVGASESNALQWRVMTRREAGKVIGGTAAMILLPLIRHAKGESSAMVTRSIPSSGEKLPVIGLGTWRAFDVDLSADMRRQLEDVLSTFVKLGGRVIDSSPMYGRAEEVIGQLTSALGIRDKVFPQGLD